MTAVVAIDTIHYGFLPLMSWVKAKDVLCLVSRVWHVTDRTYAVGGKSAFDRLEGRFGASQGRDYGLTRDGDCVPLLSSLLFRQKRGMSSGSNGCCVDLAVAFTGVVHAW